MNVRACVYIYLMGFLEGVRIGDWLGCEVFRFLVVVVIVGWFLLFRSEMGRYS